MSTRLLTHPEISALLADIVARTDRDGRAHILGLAAGWLLETFPEAERPAALEQVITNMRRGLRGAPDARTVAERAMIAWLDTVAPEASVRALEAAVVRIRWGMERG